MLKIMILNFSLCTVVLTMSNSVADDGGLRFIEKNLIAIEKRQISQQKQQQVSQQQIETVQKVNTKQQDQRSELPLVTQGK